MSFRNAVKISLAVALVAGVLAWSNDTGKSTTVKGYVLDSACAFTKGLKKPISAECATACAKAGSFGDFDGRRHHLLAHCGHDSIQRAERPAPTVRRTEGYG